MMKFKGTMPALVTPLTEKEEINVPVLERMIGDFIDSGIADGFYVGGATGEGISLRPDQRRILAEAAVRKADHRRPCIIQVASTDFNEVIALAKHAESIGAEAVSATAPIFYKYGEDDVYNYYKRIAESVHIPLMIYYSPLAGVNFSARFAARMFEIDNITAIKWTSSDYFGLSVLKELTHGEMDVINGFDEMLLMGLSAGADGGIGTTYNFQLENIRRVYDSFMAGDLPEAMKAQTKVNKIVDALLRYNVVSATKVMTEAKGYAVGDPAFPMRRYNAEEKKQIISEIVDAGFEL